MIKLQNINKIYRTSEIETLALENVNMEIARGEFVSVMGPSGCGKSTLLNIIGLLDAPTEGTVEIDGTTTSSMSDSALAAFRNSRIGFVFQSFHLIPTLNVADNVELPLIYRKGISSAERRRMVRDVLNRVGLSHRMHHMPAQLSGGQCQRVAIARALIHDRSILLVDEGTSALDQKNADIVEKSLLSNPDLTLILVSHHLTEERQKQFDRVYRL